MNEIQKILQIMNENPMEPGHTANLSGAKYAQVTPPGHDYSIDDLGGSSDLGMIETESHSFTAQEVKLARRFVQLIGDPSKARDLVERVVQADADINVEPDYEQIDRQTIDHIGNMTPDEPDSPVNYSSYFDPSSR